MQRQLAQVLQQTFGFNQLRKGQQQVIETVLAGRSSAAIFPTGSGKSLCYQLPALMLPHLTLVISPLIALMKDQLEFLKSKGIAAATIDSSQDKAQSQQVMADVRDGKIKILMVSVERLKNERFRNFIQQIPISMLVVDEAHCISEWGHNFRPDYLKLPYYRQLFNIPQVLLLTATATENVIADMGEKFGIQQDDICITGFYRSNLHLYVEPCPPQQKANQIAQYLTGSYLAEQNVDPNKQAAIIYVTLQHTAQWLADFLQQKSLDATAYHAGLDSDVRQNIQQNFMQGRNNIIVATIAFGMGIDKSDIRHVIHYDLPKSIENYSQEIGRAGRDGQTSNCVLFASQENLPVLENFIYGDSPELSAIQIVLNDIQQAFEQQKTLSYDASQIDWEFTLYQLSAQSNVRQLPLKTLLVYLELKNIISAKYSYFAEYKFKLEVPEQQLIDTFNGERQTFIQAVLAYSKKGRTWYSIDFDAIYQNYHSEQADGSVGSAERNRVIKALDYLAEKNLLQLESKQMTEVYQVNQWASINQQSLAEEIFVYFQQKENSEIQRIHNMLELFQKPVCFSAQLADYFSDHVFSETLKGNQAGCGHCSVCLGQLREWSALENNSVEQALQQANKNMTQLQQEFITPLKKSVADKFQSEASDQLVAKALCGITLPWLTKAGARKLPGFAVFEKVQLQSVLDYLKTLQH